MVCVWREKELRLTGKRTGRERERERETWSSEAWSGMNAFEPEAGSWRAEESIS